MGDLTGRVAFLTGGGRGIGAATAHILAARGAAVAIADRDLAPAQEVAAEIAGQGGRALALGVDVTDRAQMEAVAARVVAEFGHLDILVALAGVTRDNLFFRMSDEQWQDVIQTNLYGSFLAAQVCQGFMVQQRFGKIVFISSISALGNRGQANYSAAKMGLQGLTRTLALELGPHNVNVNCVAPGFIETRMTRAISERTGIDFEQLKAEYVKEIPLQRIGQPDDIGKVIAFLVSDDASYVTGQTMYVAGGLKT